MNKKPTGKMLTIVLLAALITGLGLPAFSARTVRAATIGVTTFDDELNSDGDCSLREAVRAANNDSDTDACPPGSGADTIFLPAGNYILSLVGNDDDASAGDLDITQDLTLVGAGPLQTSIDANGIDRAIQILGNASTRISRLTIAGGNPSNMLGAGIYVYQGSLTLNLSRIWHNTGTASISVAPLIANALTILDSRIQDNSGSGVLISGNAAGLISDSTISGNSTSGSGGGVSNAGEVTIVNSTISGNNSAYDGGGINTSNGQMQLFNVTITNNTSDSDNNSFGNGGGIAIGSYATVTFQNTIIAGNFDLSNPGLVVPDCSGVITSQGYNQIQSTLGCGITGDTTGNIVNQSASLGPLQNNGGPTFTHALQNTSLAINTGNPNGCLDQNGALLTLDQRGYVRNGRCDIGAYEYASLGTPTPSNTPTSTSTTAPTNTATLGPSPSPTYTPAFSSTPSATPISSPTATPTRTPFPPTPLPMSPQISYFPLILNPGAQAIPTGTPAPTAAPTVTPVPTIIVPTATALPKINKILVVDYAYQPTLLTIHAGEIVEWENTGAVDHTATSITGVFDSGTLAPTQKYQFLFTGVGTYDYYCSFHADMAGTVVVVP